MQEPRRAEHAKPDDQDEELGMIESMANQRTLTRLLEVQKLEPLTLSNAKPRPDLLVRNPLTTSTENWQRGIANQHVELNCQNPAVMENRPFGGRHVCMNLVTNQA